jgi:Fur family peroxide stress response transcriptional regulator
MEEKEYQEKITQFMQKCRAVGLSVTPQRLAVYQALIESSAHPSPDDIYRKINPTHPTISLATVYKTLETFEKHRIISTVTSLYNTIRYDPLTLRHHHIICVRCKKVIDLEDAELDALKIPAEVTRKNALINFSVHFNVICSDCMNK